MKTTENTKGHFYRETNKCLNCINKKKCASKNKIDVAG